jgi:hypothetical protein
MSCADTARAFYSLTPTAYFAKISFTVNHLRARHFSRPFTCRTKPRLGSRCRNSRNTPAIVTPDRMRRHNMATVRTLSRFLKHVPLQSKLLLLFLVKELPISRKSYLYLFSIGISYCFRFSKLAEVSPKIPGTTFITRCVFRL